MNCLIYPVKLAEFLQENNYIPRKIRYNEHLRMFRRYWIDYSDLFLKVDKIYNVAGDEYYSVRYRDNLYGEISYPLDHESTFELLLDKRGIKKLNNIINSPESFSGAEIKYWFFTHNINIKSDKYFGFLSYLDPNSKSLICDSKYYFVSAIFKDDKYINCRINLDREKEFERRR